MNLAGALLLLGLCADSFGFGSKAAFFGSIAIGIAGLVWLTRAALFMAPREGILYRRRREIALSLWSTLIFASIAVAVSAVIEMGPSAAFRRIHMSRTETQSQQGDPEIGWAPAGPPDVVGQRLQKLDPSREQILMIGDSILFGLNVEEKDTAPALMQKEIGNYQVVNLSVSGWSIEQYWLYLRRVLPNTKPKLIVVGLFTGNDFQLTGREYSPWAHSKPLYVVEGDKLVRANRAEACIDGLAQSLLFRALWKKPERAVEIIQLFCHPRELKFGELERAIGKMFDEIEALGKAKGAKVLFVLLPTRHELNLYAEEWTRYMSKYPELRRILETGHHETFDFYETLLKSKQDLDAIYQADNAHYRPAGQKLLADSLMKYLGEKGTLK